MYFVAAGEVEVEWTEAYGGTLAKVGGEIEAMDAGLAQLGVALGLGSGKVSTVASQMHRDGEVTREKVRAVWVYQLAVPPASGRRNG